MLPSFNGLCKLELGVCVQKDALLKGTQTIMSLFIAQIHTK